MEGGSLRLRSAAETQTCAWTEIGGKGTANDRVPTRPVNEAVDQIPDFKRK